MTKLVRVPLTNLELDPDNVRSSYNEEQIANLREALKAALEANQEYIHPPTVYPIGAGRYRVKHGHCRVMAAQGVVDQLNVLVTPPPRNRGEKVLDQLSENLLQGGLSAIDTAAGLKRLRDAEELSVAGLVDLLASRGIGHGRFWVKMHLGLLELEPSVQDHVRSGRIPPRVAWLLRNVPRAEQPAWAQRVIEEGLTQVRLEQALGLGQDQQDNGSSGDIDVSRPEFGERQLDERIRELAAGALGRTARERKGRAAEPDRRNSPVQRRWSLMPLEMEASPVLALDDQDWARAASDLKVRLAKEAVLYGGQSAEQAIEIAEKATTELDTTPEWAIVALNILRELLDNPRALDHSPGVAELLKIRMKHTLSALSQPPA